MIRKLLENHIKNNVPDSEVAVLLSGGVDSISVALSANDAGYDVYTYTFHLKDNPSYDSQKAKHVSEVMGWECKVIEIDTDNIKEDWHRLVKHGCRKKTHFECVYPFLYVYPEIKQKYVLTGWAADGYFGPSKKASLRYTSFSKAKSYMRAHRKDPTGTPRVTWNEFRIKYLDGDCAGLQQHTNLALAHNKHHITPYRDEKIREILMQKTWKQLNKPRQKEFIRKDFTELEKFGKVKYHENLHLNAGIHKVFEKLLDDSEINRKGRKRMMDVCRDWYIENSFNH